MTCLYPCCSSALTCYHTLNEKVTVGTYSMWMGVWMEFISCRPTLRMHVSWSPPPHDHKMPKYKLSKLHYRSHGVGAGFWGTKGQEKAGSPCEGCIFVKRWVTVNIWICTIKTVTRENWTFIQFWEICLLLLRYEVSYWQWFPEACQDQLPSSLGIPVVFSFPEDDEREEEEEGEAAALHRDVWDSSCNPWPLPQRQVSYLVI